MVNVCLTGNSITIDTAEVIDTIIYVFNSAEVWNIGQSNNGATLASNANFCGGYTITLTSSTNPVVVLNPVASTITLVSSDKDDIANYFTPNNPETFTLSVTLADWPLVT